MHDSAFLPAPSGRSSGRHPPSVVLRPRRESSGPVASFGWGQLARYLAVVLALSWASVASAVGLGGLNVLSALGQPLHLEVAITGWAGEPISAVRLPGPVSRGRQSSTPLQFEIDGAGSALPLLRIRSREPIDEPYMELVLQLDSPQGRVVRAYTFLLDPPGMRPVGETVPGTTLSRSLNSAGISLAAPPVALAAPLPVPERPAVRVTAPTVTGPIMTGPTEPAMPLPGAAPVSAPAASTAPVAGAPAVAQATSSGGMSPPASATAAPPSAPTASSLAAPSPPTPAAAPAGSSTSAPAIAPSAGTATAAALPAVPPPVAPPPVASPPVASPAGPITELQVSRGITLGELAEKVRPPGASLDQVMVALYRANPAAFGGSVHVLLAGSRLNVPTAAEISAVSVSEARQVIRLHTEQFRARREQIAVAPRLVETNRPSQAAGGAVGGATPPVVADGARGDRLELSRTGVAGSAGGDAPVAMASAEARTAMENALREQNERIALLEENLKNLQTLLALRNEQLAQLQSRTQVAPAGPSVALGSGETASTAKDTGGTGAAAESSPPASDTPAAEAAAPASAAPASTAPASTAPAGTPAPETAGLPSQGGPGAISGPPIQSSEELTGFAALMAHPWVLPGAAAGLALLVALIGWSLFGSRKPKPLLGDEDLESRDQAVLTTESPGIAPMPGPTQSAAEEPASGLPSPEGQAPADSSRASDPPSQSPSVSTAPVSELQQAVAGRFDLPSLDLSGEPAPPAVAAAAAKATPDRSAASALAVTAEPAAPGESSASVPAAASAAVETAPSVSPAATAPAAVAPAIRRQMASQLELASAYLEIGDHERVRELVENVLAKGDPVQQRRAREMLDRL